MANKSQVKNFTYSRANFGMLEQPNSLETDLRTAHALYNLPEERIFVYSSMSLKGYKFEALDNGVLIHAVVYEAGMPASIINNETGDVDAEVTTHDSPNNKDYLQKEVFAYISGNDVVICTHNTRESTFLAYCKFMLSKVDAIEAAENLMIEKIGDINKLALIRKEGIKKINLNVSLYKASRDYIESQQGGAHVNKVKKLLAGIGNDIAMLFSADDDHNVAEDENLNISLSMSFDGKEARSNLAVPEFGETGKSTLLKTAENVLDAEENDFFDGFEIVTSKDKSIKYNSIKVQGKYRVKTVGTSLFRVDVWTKLEAYYNEIKGNGTLEQ